MSEKYRVAIVGCGGISTAHGIASQTLSEIDLVAACDVKFEAVKNFAERFNVENTYNDLRRMLEQQQPDVLIVATWPTLHLKHILEGVRCGVKGILCEKPIAIDTTQLEQMIQVTSTADVLLMEGFMYRHHPLTRSVKQHILDGAIGEVRFAGSSFSTGLTDRTNWRLRGDQGGGAVMDLGCYCINVIRHMVGAEPQAVWATGKFEPISDVWDTLIGTLDFGDGITGQFDCSFGWTWRECYEVAGTEGTIFAPKAWGNSEGKCGFTLIRDGKTETVTVEGVNPYAAELLSLCEAVSTGKPPLLPIADALANMRVIDGLHESAHTERRVEVNGT